MSNGDGSDSKRHIRSRKGHISLKISGRFEWLPFSNDFTGDQVIPKMRGGDQDYPP
jgi:hypothetical protein